MGLPMPSNVLEIFQVGHTVHADQRTKQHAGSGLTCYRRKDSVVATPENIDTPDHGLGNGKVDQ